jgi:hypothetical protein
MKANPPSATAPVKPRWWCGEKVGDQNKCMVEGTDTEGNKTHSVWTGKLDGKFYAITGDPQPINARSRRVMKIPSRW